MADAGAGVVNWLKGKAKVDIGNAMPTARVHPWEDAPDLTRVSTYY